MRKPPSSASAIASSPGTSFRLMIFAGASRPSFRRSRRSIPPAFTTDISLRSMLSGAAVIASATVADAAAAASEMVLAFAKAKRFTASTPLWDLAERGEHRRRRHRQAAQADADGVVDGVGDRRRSGDVGGLGNAVGIRSAVTLIVFQDHDVDRRRLVRAGELVMFKVRVDHAASVLVEDAVLEQCIGEPHQNAAMHLALDLPGIYRPAAILYRNDALHAHDAGLGVDCHCGKLDAAQILVRQSSVA